MIKNFIIVLLLAIITNTAFAQSQPSAQATGLSFIGIKAYGMSISFQSSDASNYLVLRSTEPITGVPVDGNSYVKGEWIGNGKVLANGTNSFYTFREAIANTEYYFAVFAYNDGATPNYLTNNPLSGSVTTFGKNIANYYSNYRIDTDDAISDLTDLLKSHNDLNYSGYRDVVENILQKDTTEVSGGNVENRKFIIGEYSNIVHLYEDDIDFNDYNREHVMARSWMPSAPSSDNDWQNETSDYHNLFLVKASVNQSLRSNYIFDEVASTSNSEGDSKNGDNVNGTFSFEPKEDVKGNIARTLFYASITYDGVSGSWAFNNLASNGDNQNVDLLVQWHLQDPVDNFEIARNEYIYSIQNNRNPFVDYPEWVACIDFKTLTLNGTCPLDTAQGVPDAIQTLFNSRDVSVYPNPVKEKAFVKISENEDILELSMSSINGQEVYFEAEINENIADLNLSALAEGLYILKIRTDNRIYNKHLLLKK